MERGRVGEARQVAFDGGTLLAEGFETSLPRTALLLAGAAMQATTWERQFFSVLNERGVGVIRFDWRDIGQSTWRRFKEVPYSIGHLAEDVASVAEAFGRDTVHLVGFSMGGCVAQLTALAHPARIESLSLLSSGFASRIDVPRPERAGALFDLFSLPRPVDRDEHVRRLVDQWRVLCGRAFVFDEDAWRRRAEAWVDRGQNPSCPHIRLGPQVFGVERAEELARLDVPTLVVHGTDDPMFPHVHGEAIARTIPAAKLTLLDGRGHDLHVDPVVAELVADHIVSVTRA